jgi:glucose/arabinose dehydrogenase
MPVSAASYRATLVCAALALGGCGDGGADGPLRHEAPSLGVERVFPLLAFSQPVAMLQAPGDATRWFVVEQAGRVRVFANSQQAAAMDTFADVSDRVTAGGERGLLGMAFHPDFPIDPRVFLSYTNETAGALVSRVSAFVLAIDGSIDETSEKILLRIAQPQGNHNGGQVAFGPDGFLYAGLGDGGGGFDPHGAIGNGQRMTTLLGKMLRIDVSPALGYDVPLNNPFAGAPQCGAGGTGAQPCPEIYASGFRNPWRWSFDGGVLWVGDVGQSQREELDRVVRGGNYGWRCFEGTRDTGLACGTAPNLLPPVAEYGRGVGESVTGGFVYRGSAIEDLFGRYVFGDFVSGRLMHVPADAAPTRTLVAGFETGLNISSFGRDAAGDLYVVHYGGELYRVVRR